MANKNTGAKRGFAAMSADKQREIASMGGKASHGGGRKAGSGGKQGAGGGSAEGGER